VNSSLSFGNMSRLGKIPVAIPAGVTITCDNGLLTVTGAKGTLTRTLRSDVTVVIAENEVVLTPGTTADAPALWGTYAAHMRNMIKGVSEGFTKVLDIEGVGYRAEAKGTTLVLNVGYSHPVTLAIPAGVTALVEKSAITLTAADKDLLGQFAADVRKVRKPEPYKGKGIRYRGEYIIRKQGKKAA
jgi:large subunit ribosomal protein L6